MARKRRIDVKGILADPDLRRKLMVPTIQATQAREGIETTREQADRAYYVVTEGERATFFDLQRFRGRKGQLDRRHEMFVLAIQNAEDGVRFDVARRDFSSMGGVPIAYSRVGLVAHIFREFPSLEPFWGFTRRGASTGSDPKYVRFWWEIEKLGRKDRFSWNRFAKGGAFCRFYADIELVVHWDPDKRTFAGFTGRKGREIERPEALDDFFRKGLTWPRRTAKGFNIRKLPEGCIFADKGPSLFPSAPRYENYLLGICNSAFFEYLLRTRTSFSWEVGIMKSMPIPEANARAFSSISSIASDIYEIKSEWDSGNEISTRFTKPWLLLEGFIDHSAGITERLDLLAAYEATEDARIQEIYRELNDEVYRLYGIPYAAKKTVEETLGDRPPEIIWPQMEGKGLEQKRIEHVWRLLLYVVKRIVEEDEDGVVPFQSVSGKAAIIERVYRELENLFPKLSISQVEVEIVNELKQRVKGYRAVNSIREWLEDVYFQYHVSLYKNRPIFWHIASRQGKSPTFSAFVQYHRFDKNAMAVLRGTYIREAIAGFRREAALASKEGREGDRVEWQSKLEEATELDQKLQMVQEGHHEGMERGDRDYRILTPWKSSEDRPKGWDPDIDDGVKVNIEPLQKAGVLRIAKVV